MEIHITFQNHFSTDNQIKKSWMVFLISCFEFFISCPFSIAVVIDCAYIIGLFNSIVKKKDKFFYQ